MIRTLVFTLILAAAPVAALTKPVSAGLSASDKALVDGAARYMQGLRSAEARFSQTDPRGAVTSGTFSLQRPGKARFAYDPPTGLTVVADGANVDVYDARLKTFDAYPQKNTPLAMLLAGDVRFDSAASVTGVERDRGGFTVTLRDARKQAQGRLALSFTTGPLALAGWTVTDAQGMRTTVRLSGLKSGVALAPDLFVLHDPRPRLFKP